MCCNSDMQRRVCVFCGSKAGNRPVYRTEALALGRLLGENGLGLVYGGAQVGLMGNVADAALAHGSEVIGVIPSVLAGVEVAHQNLTRLVMVGTMHERKALMAQEADAFMALPGGFGTLDEFFEILTWAQLEIHSKPCLLVNTEGYFDQLLAFLEMTIREGFLKTETYNFIHVVRDAAEAVAHVQQLWKDSPPNHAALASPAP
jgi:uncharacterized protein (TIGR00730 family)